MDNIIGKNILITGASSGIGEACARRLAKDNNTLFLVARNKEKLDNLSKELGGRVFVYEYDLIKTQNIIEIFEFCTRNKKKLDCMIHAAGVSENMPLKNHDMSLLEAMFKVNYFSFIELVKYFTQKKYSNDNSSIVVVSSTVAQRPSPGNLGYSASKAAVNISVKVMAKELLKRSIRINAIMPGFVRTRMFEAQINEIEGFEEQLINSQPLGIIEPEYVAEFAAYLLSDKAKYFTGLALPMDAGYLL